MALVLGETKPSVLWPGVVAPDDAKAGVVPSTDKRTGYVPPSEPNGEVSAKTDPERISKLRKFLRDYVDLKSEEIEERREAQRYYHCKQWTAEEIAKHDARSQPTMTWNRIVKVVNGTIGLMERLRQDPKAFPRHPDHEQGADVASQALRYALDASDWEGQHADFVQDLCLAGIGGFELALEQTDDESEDPISKRIRPETFFYDPRSVEYDFSDARFLGIAKWMDKDEAIAFMPWAKEKIDRSLEDLSSSSIYAEALDPDKENLWWDRELKKIRIVDVYYREGATWLHTIHTGTEELGTEESRFVDAKGKSAPGFAMQSFNIDEKGNRYGVVRNLKSPQDQINFAQSRATHAANTKQLLIEEGAVEDVEALRKEIHKPDGVLALPQGQAGKMSINSNAEIVTSSVTMLQFAIEEMERLGPNMALIGQGMDNKSGRAIALLQQAAIAEMGPFIVRVRSLKKRIYNLTWEAIRRYWKTPRYIRLTDDKELAGFLPINMPRQDEFGNVIGVENPIGKLLMDFVIDEGPDTVTLREDAQLALGQALSQAGNALPPPVVMAITRAMLENMQLPPSAKKYVTEAFEAASQPPQPDPMAQELEVRSVAADIRQKEATASDKEASAALKTEQARGALRQNSMNQVADEIAATGHASMMPAII
jgi:hypothetical protein